MSEHQDDREHNRVVAELFGRAPQFDHDRAERLADFRVFQHAFMALLITLVLTILPAEPGNWIEAVQTLAVRILHVHAALGSWGAALAAAPFLWCFWTGAWGIAALCWRWR